MDNSSIQMFDEVDSSEEQSLFPSFFDIFEELSDLTFFKMISIKDKIEESDHIAIKIHKNIVFYINTMNNKYNNIFINENYNNNDDINDISSSINER